MFSPLIAESTISVTNLFDDVIAPVSAMGREASGRLDPSRRAKRGQFMTPPPVAQLMASMLFDAVPDEVRLLDAGAGVGSLSAASVCSLLSRPDRPNSITIVAYEIEPLLVDRLAIAMGLCEAACHTMGVQFECEIIDVDFLEAAALQASVDTGERFNGAILNPPYRKIQTASRERQICRTFGLEVSNLYAGFLGATIALLTPGADLVSITPRSFTNGVYFRAFRSFLLDRVAIKRLHVFDSRQHAFRDDDVLQEKLIMRAIKDAPCPKAIEITSNAKPGDPVRSRTVPWRRVVYSNDAEQFIHLIVDDKSDMAAKQMAHYERQLEDLDIAVSTGPVVDFRATEFLRPEPEPGTVPLLYPGHMNGGTLHWPEQRGSKPNAFLLTEKSRLLTVPNGNYVLVKRFTTKEEPRRIVAAIFEAKDFIIAGVAFENHLNFFHRDWHGLPIALARGLTLYLNSSLVDTYFRLFSGHTQVNAADLRNMPYPSLAQLQAAGRAVRRTDLSQDKVDLIVKRFMTAQ